MAVNGVVLSAKIAYSSSVKHMGKRAFRGIHRDQIKAIRNHLQSVLLWDQRSIDAASANGGVAHTFNDGPDIGDAIELLLAQVQTKLEEVG